MRLPLLFFRRSKDGSEECWTERMEIYEGG